MRRDVPSPRGRYTVVASLASALALGCVPSAERPPPTDAFYWPAGIAHLDAPGSSSGVLFVASANYDRRFARGTVIALPLDGLSLPALGEATVGEPFEREALGLGDEHVRSIATLAGELAVHPQGSGARVFVPTRSEGFRVQILDVPSLVPGEVSLRCLEGGQAEDCSEEGFSLTERELPESGLPRAPEPFGVDVSGDGDVFVTHISAAESPPGTSDSFHSYLIRVSAAQPELTDASFLPIGSFPAASVVARERYVFMSGRCVSVVLGQCLSSGLLPLVRVLDRTTGALVPGAAVLEQSFRVSGAEGRGLDVSADGKRLFMAARLPDALLVANVDEPTAGAPRVTLADVIVLPGSVNALRVIDRAGAPPVVVFTSSQGDGVGIYDDAVGAVVRFLPNVGRTPFGIAVDVQGSGARVFVSNFADGRVAVIDLADLSRPQDARVVGYLGRSQECLTGGEESCGE